MTLALYVPRGSLVHRTPAGWKLLALALLSVLVFAVPTLPVVFGALIAVVVLLEAWPVSRVFWHGQRSVALSSLEWAGVGAGLLTAAAIMLAVFLVARRAGLRALARLPG